MLKYSLIFSIIILVIVSCKTNDEPLLPQTPVYNTLMRTTGDTTDVVAATSSGTCLMGGSTDVDEAFKWMISKSGGGDFVILRSDVSYGYNPYIRKLGTVNSVETIVIRKDSDAINPIVARKIRNAEALFIAGGDQADYVKLWKDTPVEDAINYLINTKHVPVGGTSAGCAIMGSSYFAAFKGSVTSTEAMHNPYNSLVSLGHNDFISNPFLQNTITDQHYSQRGREGRLVTFMARMKTDLGIINPKAIAVDEETAVCINEDGIAVVLGSNNAFFLQTSSIPEMCVNTFPLTWNQNGQAISVCKIAATNSNSFNMNNFTTTTGGSWKFYSVINGVFYFE